MGAVPELPQLPDRWWGRHLQELRWQAELARLLVDPVYRGEGVPRGDGGPVMLIPGFLAGDSSLTILADWLKRMGHRPHASGLHFNVDCSNRALLALEKRLERIVTERPAAIVGHSRAGPCAKARATRRRELVSQVISLGAGL